MLFWSLRFQFHRTGNMSMNTNTYREDINHDSSIQTVCRILNLKTSLSFYPGSQLVYTYGMHPVLPINWTPALAAWV